MPTTDIKQEAQRLIEQLPAGATWDDLMYEIYVRQAIEARVGGQCHGPNAGCQGGAGQVRFGNVKAHWTRTAVEHLVAIYEQYRTRRAFVCTTGSGSAYTAFGTDRQIPSVWPHGSGI